MRRLPIRAIDTTGSTQGQVAVVNANGELVWSDHASGAVTSVNGEAGPDVVLSAADVGASPSNHTHVYPVTSVNTKTGAVVLGHADVGAAAEDHTHDLQRYREVLMASGVTPPDPLASSDGYDWLYGEATS